MLKQPSGQSLQVYVSGPELDLDHDITPRQWMHDADGLRVTIPARSTTSITGYVKIRIRKKCLSAEALEKHTSIVLLVT